MAALVEAVDRVNTKRSGFVPRTIRLVLVDPATGDEVSEEMPHAEFWAVYQSLKAIGFNQTATVALFGATLIQPALSAEDTNKIDRKISAIYAFLRYNSNPELTALNFSYELLQGLKISREAAAKFASDILGKEVPPDSWRKRVDKFADDRGLPKVGLTRGRRKKKKLER
jgi:hypothetical protein